MEVPGEYSETVWLNGYKYTLNVKSATTADRKAGVTSIVASHKHQKSNSHVTAVSFYEIDLKTFPKGLNNFFPNLRNLELDKCQISTVSSTDLDGLENLEWLGLANNLIKTLPTRLLVNMKNLRYLYLTDNKITHLSAQFLDPLDVTKCEFIDLRKNTSINDFYQKDTHGSIEALKKAITEKCSAVIEKKSNTVVPNLMKNLLSTGVMSDFTIKVDEHEFKVHKNILAAASATFSAMFAHECEETLTGVMKIHDHTKEAVRDFIHFIYTGEIETEENAMELYQLSALYHIPVLKDLSEEMIIDNIREIDVLEVFNIGELHSSDRLKRAAVEKMISTFPGLNLNVDKLSDPTEFHNFVKEKHQLDSMQHQLDSMKRQFDSMLKRFQN